MKTILERFEEKYCPEPNTGCWLWTAGEGGTSRKGINTYGVFAGGYAHRWAYEHFKGPIPRGLTVDHKCRQTFCVNPEHMRLVSGIENIMAGNGVGVKNKNKTHCPAGHPLSGKNLYRSRRGRECRICKAANLKQWKLNRRNIA